MKIGLACVELKNNDLNFNLNNLVKTLAVASKHQVDLVLFGAQYLQGPLSLMDKDKALSIDSQLLFQIKLASTYYNCAVGVGYNQKIDEDIHESYIVINAQGNVIYQHLQDSGFTLNDKHFEVHLEHEPNVKTDSIVIWPLFTNSTPKEWFNTHLSEMREKASQMSEETIAVNSFNHHPGTRAYGGAFHLKNNQFVVNQPMEQEGLSIIEI